MHRGERDGGALAIALVLAAVAFGVAGLAARAAPAGGGEAALLQGALWAVVVALLVWHWRPPAR